MTKINLLTKFKEEKKKNLNIGDSGSVPKVLRSTSLFKIRKNIRCIYQVYFDFSLRGKLSYSPNWLICRHSQFMKTL